MVATLLLVSCAAGEGISFPDPNLEAAIREVIDKPEGHILTSDLEGLTSFGVVGGDITSLEGLQHCINLTELDLRYNQISDISPLASLTNLTELDLRYNQISDISPLVSLTNLSRLYIAYNPLDTESGDIYIRQLRKSGVFVVFRHYTRADVWTMERAKMAESRAQTGSVISRAIAISAAFIFAAFIIIPFILWKKKIIEISEWFVVFWFSVLTPVAYSIAFTWQWVQIDYSPGRNEGEELWVLFMIGVPIGIGLLIILLPVWVITGWRAFRKRSVAKGEDIQREKVNE